MSIKPMVQKIIVAVIVFALAIFIGVCVAFAATDVTFKWDANTEADLAGYRLYQSNQADVYTFGPGNEVATIPVGTETVMLGNVPDGTWYWVLTAFDISENESGPSNEVIASLDTEAPVPPKNFFIALIKKIIAWIINLFSNFRIV